MLLCHATPKCFYSALSVATSQHWGGGSDQYNQNLHYSCFSRAKQNFHMFVFCVPEVSNCVFSCPCSSVQPTDAVHSPHLPALLATQWDLLGFLPSHHNLPRTFSWNSWSCLMVLLHTWVDFLLTGYPELWFMPPLGGGQSQTISFERLHRLCLYQIIFRYWIRSQRHLTSE